MDQKAITASAVSIVFGITLIGYFLTKTSGFGKYTTAALLLVLVLYVTSLAFFLGMLDGAHFVNIIVAVAAFAGGLFTSTAGADRK